MICKNCGTENGENARFCQTCGSSLKEEPKREEDVLEANGPQKNTGPKRSRKTLAWILSGAAVLLLAVCIAGVLAFGSRKERRDYENYVASAEKYLEELDYESAEDAYLRAIEVDPKQADAYIGLTQTYLKQEDFEKAKLVLSKGQQYVSEEEASRLVASGGAQPGAAEEADTGQEGAGSQETSGEMTTFQDQVEKIEVGKNYTWVVEPAIEAEDIYYLKDENTMESCRNDLYRQMETGYAVIRQDGNYGLIGMDGVLAVPLEYRGIGTLSEFYLLERNEPQYEDEYGMGMTEYYFAEEDCAIYPAIAVIGDAGDFLYGAFYWNGGLRNTAQYHADLWDGIRYPETPPGPVPVRQSETVYDGRTDEAQWLKDLEGNYAICRSDGQLATDYIYEACGSASDGLLAVKQDGKWGYVDENGETVIPLEYDASWEYETYAPGDRTDEEPQRFSYCYAASGGYVPLVKDGEWELRDISGKLVIPSGIFEAIRPVYDGKCWVRKDGRWGVIEVGEETDGDPGTSGGDETGSTGTSALSRQEIADAVVGYLSGEFLEDGGMYTISDSETEETDTEYVFLLRYAMPEERAQEIISNGGTPSANILAGWVTVDKETMEAVYRNEMDETIRTWTVQ